MGFIDDTCKNAAGKWSSNSVMRMVVFVLGCCFATAGVVGSFYGKQVSMDPVLLSWGLAFGVAGLRIGEALLNRKTADSAGHPLAVPGTVDPPVAEPVLMPQSAPSPTPDESEAASQAL